jgi:hypothetical protein
MLKGEDIVLLLKLSGQEPDWTVRTLERETTIPRSVVQRGLKRLWQAGLFDPRRRTVNISQAEEFVIHGLRYVFPGNLGGESRGVPTAWAAQPLADLIAGGPNELPPVWPDASGTVRGLALEPVHASVVEAANRDPALGEQLALVDALRIGDARIRGLAADQLRSRLGAPVT